MVVFGPNYDKFTAKIYIVWMVMRPLLVGIAVWWKFTMKIIDFHCMDAMRSLPAKIAV